MLYLDGVEVGRNENVTLTPGSIGGGHTSANYLGRSTYDADRYLKGQVRDLRIYNRALSAPEVLDLSDDGLDLTVESELRCMPPGRVVLTLRVTNADRVPVDLTFHTALGTRTQTAVAPGRSALQAFTTTVGSLPAGVLILDAIAVVDGRPVMIQRQVALPERTC